MKITIKSKNIELTQALKDFINDRLGQVQKFINIKDEEEPSTQKGEPTATMWVEIEKLSFQNKGKVFRAEAQMRLPGKSIRSESTKEDLRTAIVEVKDELQRLLKKYKEKQSDQKEKGARRLKKHLKMSKEAKKEDEK